MPEASSCMAAARWLDACDVGEGYTSVLDECRALGDQDARPWATCMTSIDCETHRKSLMMNEGPAGACYRHIADVRRKPR